MRVTRIEFNGYRRLANASTNVDGDLTAFVGFNEAGKTSILDGLAWFTSGGALKSLDFNRGRPPSSDLASVVKVFFELDAADNQALSGIVMENHPQTLVLYRKRDGNRIREFRPKPTRPTKPFHEASERLARARSTLGRHFEAATDEETRDPNDWADAVREPLTTPDAAWNEEELDALAALRDWMREVPQGRKLPRDARLSALLDDIHGMVSTEHPEQAAWNALADREPDFVLFKEADRVLETTYEINPDQRDIHPAVSRLLALAGVDLDDMWSYVQGGDSTKRETALERGNDRLRALFDQAWNQSKVTVRFNMNASRLEVLIKELHGDGDVTNISERSDGLKAFVALVAFLETGDYSVPPVLLIDEAETHLHYDAQADLVGALLKSVETTQVFYTTHSPGCLPGDLGTGIRVVAREEGYADASVIKNNFWEGDGPGFSPLLFAMGAGAAAFSMCRNAVLAEGAADMVLLPTLIRQATGQKDLDYQVAPGLANAHGSGIRVEEVAAKVVYLVDGDSGGDKHRANLRAVGVDNSRIFSLPIHAASEDLIHPDDYVTVVNDLLNRMGQSRQFSRAEVPADTPIAKAFEDWCRAMRLPRPSKVEVAYRLLRFKDRRLSPAAKRALVALHSKWTAAFAARSDS